jgi:hypothetical protein
MNRTSSVCLVWRGENGVLEETLEQSEGSLRCSPSIAGPVEGRRAVCIWLKDRIPPGTEQQLDDFNITAAVPTSVGALSFAITGNVERQVPFEVLAHDGSWR